MPKTDFDYIVVGSGIAGLNVALLARDHGSVLIITKGNIDDCNTRYAQGGIAAAVGPGDSVELHLRDTLSAGAGLCDTQAVEVLTLESEFAAEALEGRLRVLGEELGLSARQFFGLLRVAATGRQVSPPLFETMEVLGRERCLARTGAAATALAG